MVAPRLSMERSLVFGAVSITITEHGTPAQAGGKGHALRRIAGADGPHAVLHLIGRQLAHRVPRAANLERSDRLQRFELEIDLWARSPAAMRTAGRA